MEIEHIILIGAGIYLVIINLIAFALMASDKARAMKGAWRIPEKTLFLAVILGGSIGGLVGMKKLRHKTQHWYFAIGFPAILVLHIALVVFLGYIYLT